MEKEAYLFNELDNEKVMCLTCRRRCAVKECRMGWCQTRINRSWKLYSPIYGELSSLSIIPIEKNRSFIFILDLNGFPWEAWDAISAVQDARTGT